MKRTNTAGPRKSQRLATVDIVVMRDPGRGKTPYPVTIKVDDGHKVVFPTHPNRRFDIIPSQDLQLNEWRTKKGKPLRGKYSVVVAPFGMTIASDDKQQDAIDKAANILGADHMTPAKLTQLIDEHAVKYGLRGE